MSEYPDNQVNVTLPDPGEGYKWDRIQEPGNDDLVYRKVPITKEYDWSKVSPDVLVENHAVSPKMKKNTVIPTGLVTGIWQAHIGGEPCPVHAEATMIDVRGTGGTIWLAANVDWSNDRIYRVTALAPGYKYL